MRGRLRIRTVLKLLILVCPAYIIVQAFLHTTWIGSKHPTECENSDPLCPVKHHSTTYPYKGNVSIKTTKISTTSPTKTMLRITEYGAITVTNQATPANLAAKPTVPSPNIKFIGTDPVVTYAQHLKEKFLLIGIPTIGRININYLIDTLKGLIEGLDEDDKSRILIIVFMADFNQDVNNYMKELLEVTFPRHVNKIIHCIRAPRSFYPKNMDFPPLWGHSILKTNWLGKQSLDYAFLWEYCYKWGFKYYLHLEDDVLSQHGYFKKIERFVNKHQSKNWSVLEFGDQGSIGMLYRSSHLRNLHKFTWIFSWFYPVSTLIRQFNEFHLYGNPEWAKLKPALFQHIGSVSSFQGQKSQKVNSQALFHQNFNFPPDVLTFPENKTYTDNDVFMVIGVPTVKRKDKNYLITTLHGLIDGLQESEKKQVLILIFLSDLKAEAFQSVVREVKSVFPNELNSGLMKIIKAPLSYYPTLEGLPVLWKDKPQRVKWRSKQVLDYAFLFNHVYNNYSAKYYLHVEDDLIIKKGYLTHIIGFIKRNHKKNWSILEFANTIGFIGWMYRSADLGRLAKFLRTYYWSLPVDMLSRHYNEFHLYGNPKWAVYEPQLFLHGGLHSSLDGVTRKATVVPVIRYENCTNPEANISTSIKNAMPTKYTDISRIYRYKSLHDYFWGKDFDIGDYILLRFIKNETNVVKIAVLSGGEEAGLDFFGGAKISWSDSQNCDKYISWKSFKEKRELIAVSKDPKGILCKCIKIEVTALRKDKKGRPRWLYVQEIAVWTI